MKEKGFLLEQGGEPADRPTAYVETFAGAWCFQNPSRRIYGYIGFRNLPPILEKIRRMVWGCALPHDMNLACREDWVGSFFWRKCIKGSVKSQSSSQVRDKRGLPFRTWARGQSFLRAGKRGWGIKGTESPPRFFLRPTQLEFEVDEFSWFSHNITRKRGKMDKIRNVPGPAGHTVQCTPGHAADRNLGA